MQPHSRRPRRFRCRTTLILPLALALAQCAPAAPPPPAAALPEPPPPPPVRQVRPVLRADWTFQASPDACIATARAGSASLTVAVRATGPVRLTLVLPQDLPDHALARFHGPAGSWEIRAAAASRHAAIFLLPRTETTLGRILVLLGGGQLVPEQLMLPILALPESGGGGRRWFACARSSVNGA